MKRPEVTDRACGDDDRFLPARAVWERYDVTSMSIWRWLRDPAMGFPRPVLFGRLRYWKLSELLAWEASRPRASAQPVRSLATSRAPAKTTTDERATPR